MRADPSAGSIKRIHAKRLRTVEWWIATFGEAGYLNLEVCRPVEVERLAVMLLRGIGGGKGEFGDQSGRSDNAFRDVTRI